MKSTFSLKALKHLFSRSASSFTYGSGQTIVNVVGFGYLKTKPLLLEENRVTVKIMKDTLRHNAVIIFYVGHPVSSRSLDMIRS